MILTTGDIALALNGLTIGCLLLMGWAMARLRATVAQATVDKEKLAKLEGDLTSVQSFADATSKSAAAIRASHLGAAQVARQLATELERGMR